MRTKKTKGIFITFEGPDGSGKSTQIKLLTKYFEKHKLKYILTREAGGTNIGESLRNILADKSLHNKMSAKTEALLLQAARAQHVYELINPALKRGLIVLCDRYIDSSSAYQAIGRGLGNKVINMLNKFSTSGLVPNLTILLDLPAKTGLQRVNSRKTLNDRWELEKAQFHEKVRKAYLALAKKNPKRIKVISANAEIEKIHKKIVSIIHNELGIL